jgi:hypothetical protein
VNRINNEVYQDLARHLWDRFNVYDNATLDTPHPAGGWNDGHIGLQDFASVAYGEHSADSPITENDRSWATWVLQSPQYYDALAQLNPQRQTYSGETDEFIESFDLHDALQGWDAVV